MSQYARYNRATDLGATFTDDGCVEYWLPNDPERHVIFKALMQPPKEFQMTQEEWDNATWLCLEARIHPKDHRAWYGNDIMHPNYYEMFPGFDAG